MILITGATGIVGRPLVELLRIAGADIRAVTRSAAPGSLGEQVEVVEGDPSRPDTIAASLSGVTSLFVHPRAVGAAAVGELLALAEKEGVERVVVLSAVNVDDPLDEQPSRYNGDRNTEVERAVVGGGLSWVSLRPSGFATNAVRSWGAQIARGDVVFGPYANFAEAPIDPRDIAAVAARALLTDELAGQRVELTGPQSLTHEEMIAIIGDAIGRPLRYQQIPPEAARDGMVRNGLSEPFADALLARYERGAGRPAPTNGEVRRILGRPPRDFAGWAADHAAAFGFQPPEGTDGR